MYREIPQNFGKLPNPKQDQFLDIGGVILSFMEEKNVGGAELARLSRVSESEVYNVLKNRRSRSGLKTLQKLATPLGKTLADIFNQLSKENEGNVKKIEKEPSFIMEFKKQGVAVLSDIPPYAEFFIGKMTLAGGSKGFHSDGLKDHCSIFLRVTRGAVDVEYAGSNYALSTYQKIILNGKYKHSIKNRSGTEPAETLLVSAPSFLTVGSA